MKLVDMVGDPEELIPDVNGPLPTGIAVLKHLLFRVLELEVTRKRWFTLFELYSDVATTLRQCYQSRSLETFSHSAVARYDSYTLIFKI